MQKKVLIAAGALTIGGAEKVARDIALYGDPKRYTFHYLVFGEARGEYEGELRRRGCEIFHFPEPSEDYFRFLQQLKYLMDAQNYDIVHAHTMFSCGWVMAVGYLAGVPVRIAHAHSALNDGGGLVKTAYEGVMGFLIRRFATAFLACSHPAGLRLFGKRIWETKGKLVENGIDLEKFAFSPADRSEIRSQLGWEDRFILGHGGHLTAVKNQRFLLELLPEILKIRPDAALLLLGEGEDRTLLEEITRKLGLQGRVILTGNVPEVGPYLSAMDVFLLPSLYEGMPLALLEARANGLPCLTADTFDPAGLPLDGPCWVEAICAAKRGPGAAVPDIRTAMQTVYQCYEGR